MSTEPKRWLEDAPATSTSEGRRQWASLILQAASDAAESRRQLARRDALLDSLQDEARASWHWNHPQSELEFTLYFPAENPANIRGVELIAVDGEPPSAMARLRFEVELEAEIAAPGDLHDRIVASTSEAVWPR